MSRADYAHWNEDADRIWWEEEGRHEPSEPDYEGINDDAADAFAEEVAEMEAEEIIAMLSDADYRRRWPLAVKVLQWELDDRGVATT